MSRRLAGVIVIAPIVAACTSFSAVPTGSDAGPASDGGVPETDAGLAFCQRNAGAIFCDDFEAPGRVVSPPAPWDAFTGSKAGTLSIGDGFESAAGLRVAGRFAPGEDSFLQKAVGVSNQRLRWTFRLRVTKFAEYTPSTQPQIGFAGFQFADGKYLAYVLFPGADGPSGYASSNLVSPSSVDFFDKPPVGLRSNEWMDIRVELEPQGSTDSAFRFFMGTTLLSHVTLPTGASTTIVLGGAGAGDGVDADLELDDVLVTTF